MVRAAQGGSNLRAAALTQPGSIEVKDVAEPAGDPGEALVRVRAVGICGTDLSIFAGSIPVTYPRILGHEIVGEILSAPPGASPVGCRVIVDPSVACGRCTTCREGRTNLCLAGSLMGRDRDGGLRQVMSVPARNLYEVPRDIPTDEAPLIQVLTTCIHGQRLVPVLPGERVVVVGLGVTGLLHVQLARRAGASLVIGLTRTPRKRALALDLGADLAVDIDDATAISRVREAAAGGADVVIEAAGKVATLARAVELARAGGRVLAYGTITEAEGAFPFYELYLKELVVTSPRAARPEDFPDAIEAVADGRVVLAPLVSRRAPLADAGEAIAAAGDPDSLKTVIGLT